MIPQGSALPHFLLFNQVSSCYQLKKLSMNIQPHTARKSYLQMETLTQKDQQLHVTLMKSDIT